LCVNHIFQGCYRSAKTGVASKNSIFLTPATEEEACGNLREYCSEIFEEQLDGWYRVPSAWPVNRTFGTFIRWFECSFHSVLVDLCDDPLMHDEI
jgi:hypothetical protein